MLEMGQGSDDSILVTFRIPRIKSQGTLIIKQATMYLSISIIYLSIYLEGVFIIAWQWFVLSGCFSGLLYVSL